MDSENLLLCFSFFFVLTKNITWISRVIQHTVGGHKMCCIFNLKSYILVIILFIKLVLTSSILSTVVFQRVLHILNSVGRGRNRFYRLQHPAALSLKRSLSVCKQMVYSDFVLKLMFSSIHRVVSKPLFHYLRQPFLLRPCRKLIYEMSFQYPQAYRDDAVVSKCG